MDAALAMLGRRAHPSARVRQRIGERFGQAVAERVVTRLSELGVLDDGAYAQAFARDRFERSGYGRERIRADLLARGVAPAQASAAIAAIVDDARERDAAVRALVRFRRSRERRTTDASAGAKQRNAAFRHLLGRGYPLDLIRDLIDSSR